MTTFAPPRRGFLGLAAGTLALATLRGTAIAAPRRDYAVKQITAGVLDVGYVDEGSGPAVILLHGWPYDIHSFDEVIPLLVAKGHRVIVPYLRGFGSTKFHAH